MFGFVKNLMDGGEEDLTLRPADLDNYGLLGPKLVAIAQTHRDISTAVYDPDMQQLLIGYRDGGAATVALNAAVDELRQAPDKGAMQASLARLLLQPGS